MHLNEQYILTLNYLTVWLELWKQIASQFVPREEFDETLKCNSGKWKFGN